MPQNTRKRQRSASVSSTSSSGSVSEESGASCGLLPDASKERYRAVFDDFLEHAKIRRFHNGKLSRRAKEGDIKSYLTEKKKECKNSTIWSYFSMISACAQAEWNMMMKTEFPRVVSLLKKWDKSYVRKKAKTFTREEVTSYLNLAIPANREREMTLRKAGLVLSIYGGLRSCELRNLTIGSVKTDSAGLLVTHSAANQRGEAEEKTFRIPSSDSKYVAEQMKLLLDDGFEDGPIFRGLNRTRTKYITTPMGKNLLYDIPKKVAEELGLKDPDRYTSHALRRTAATFAAEQGATDTELKKHFGWKSQKTASRYIDNTTHASTKMSRLLQPSPEPSVPAPALAVTAPAPVQIVNVSAPAATATVSAPVVLATQEIVVRIVVGVEKTG